MPSFYCMHCATQPLSSRVVCCPDLPFSLAAPLILARSSHASPTMQTDSGVSLEHAHRAHVASLASQLVPDALTSTDHLLSLALPSPSRPLTPLAIGHDERNIDFWDDRKVREWEKGASEVERWEMSKGQVEEVKRVRKDLADAVKDAQEFEATSLTAGASVRCREAGSADLPLVQTPGSSRPESRTISYSLEPTDQGGRRAWRHSTRAKSSRTC